ncbi:DeoR/GlpR family DNA-binding transcription regulator [Selenomonas artemidis]|jgi:transcriptional regulator|uniref:DeoR/GlpR family DNA-binding transcription regulator n=1 Tax=Selenomonas artemidis TaxID=671224 RepID=UPI0028E6ACF0|nr:DeoR/GlpR family DNA-binding transcription regulator [Selenomonas artemidis]
MSEIERIDAIMNILYQKSIVKNEELEEKFNASSVTIRRDLGKLQKEGLIVRFRGGAMLAKSKLGHEPSLDERECENLQQKRMIGITAANLVEKGDIVALDIGSTTMEIAKALRSHENITVFTSSLPIANIFYNTNVKVYLVGGLLKQKELCLGGPIARSVIRQYHFDKFFLGAAGIDQNGSITDFDIDEVETKKVFIERSEKVILAADSGKMGKTSFIEVASCPAVCTLITDGEANFPMRKKLQERGMEVIIADAFRKSPHK